MNEFKVSPKENGEGIILTVTHNDVSSQHFELSFNVCEQIYSIVQMAYYREDVEEYLAQYPDLEDEDELSEEEIKAIVNMYKENREDTDDYMTALDMAVSDFLEQREVEKDGEERDDLI